MTTINAHVHMEPDDNPVEIEPSDVQDNSSSTDRGKVQSAQRYRRTPTIGPATQFDAFDLDNKLGLSPPCRPDSQVKRVLDVGTGTGIWATDFGDEHPEAKVIGVDLSPVQSSFVPANVQFELDDIDEDWTYSEPFDFIHSRFMNFSVQNWKSYLTKIYENLTPGGYVELQDVDVIMGSDDGTLKPDTTMYKWCQLLDEAAGTFNRSFERTTNFKTLLQEVGFVEVVETRYKWPTNGWPRDKKYKELGHWNNANASLALEALTMAPFTRGLGWSREEVESFLIALKSDWNNPKIHAYWPICVTYAKKPEA
ncbi:hypothetical protein NXS19_011045 [Fusarium pseudograminearum]|nr:hypothetical protein NXS19_011045 [Fusarium pseudograminearum]